MVTRDRRMYLNFLYRGLYCISGNLNYFCSVWFIFYGCFADKLACSDSFLFRCHGATLVQSLLWGFKTRASVHLLRLRRRLSGVSRPLRSVQ